MRTPRRAPYPFDIVLNGHGYILLAPEKGARLIATKPPDQANVSPTDYGYNAQSPTFERVIPYHGFAGGMGLETQEQFLDDRYDYALGVDCSCGIPIKGPFITTYTPSAVDSTVGVTHFYKVGGSLFAANGRYVHKRNSDVDWNTGRQDFNPNKVYDVAVFHSNALATQYAYLAMGDACEIYRHDGTTYSQHNEGAGKELYAQALVVVGREFYRGLGNTLSKCDTDSDPFLWAEWGAANQFLVGDKASPIVRLAVTASGAMVIYKTDGIYTLGPDGDYCVLFPFLKGGIDDDNGKANTSWMNDLVVTYKDGTYRINVDWTIEPIGPERLLSNRSEVHGRITALKGHSNLALYAGLYNPDNGNSYLLKFGSWTAEGGKVVEAWHGSISPAFEGKKITCLEISDVGAPAGHQRMYIGFSDGSIGWFTLPCAKNALACDEYLFNTQTSYLFLPRWNGLFHADVKSLHAVTGLGLNLSPSNYVTMEYRLDGASTWGAMPAAHNETPRKKVEFPENTSCTYADLRLALDNTVSSETPQMTGIGIHHKVRPELKLIYELVVAADEGIVKRDGTRLLAGPSKIRERLREAYDIAGSFTMVLPDEQSKQVTLIDWAETVGWDGRLGRHRAGYALKLAEYSTNVQLGLYARLEQYTYAQLETMTFDQVEVL